MIVSRTMSEPQKTSDLKCTSSVFTYSERFSRIRFMKPGSVTADEKGSDDLAAGIMPAAFVGRRSVVGQSESSTCHSVSVVTTGDLPGSRR